MVNGSRSRTKPRSGKKPGKGRGGSVVFVVLLLSAIFAFFQIPANPTVGGIWESTNQRADQVEQWTKDLLTGGGFNTPVNPTDPGTGGGGGGVTPVEGSTPAGQALSGLTVGEPQNVNYNRNEWRHWDDLRSCWSVREQVLVDEAVPDGTLTLLDRNKVRTNDINNACYVAGGTWNDPYTGEEFRNPEDLDIDHMVPLGYAAKQGGQAWDENRKRAYANDLGYSEHLIAVSASANRSKSDRGPSEWQPDNDAYLCKYAENWITVSSNWQLTIPAADKESLAQMLTTCG